MDVGNIAELNTFLVLDAIRARGAATRSQLSGELGLSDASISRIVKRLLAGGSIDEVPGATAIRGRTPSILRFVGPAGGVIAVDLGGTHCRGALADLAGRTVAEDFRDAGDGADAAASLLGCVAALREAAAGLGIPVRAVVVGIPALIDPVSGLATAGPNVHWQDFDLLDLLGRELAEPFEVDNDVNLAALGQAWRGAGRGVGSFVTMSLGTGVGGAVVLDGHLVRGHHNAGGEIGYFPVRRSSLEDVVSGRALHARAVALLGDGVDSSLDAATFAVADLFAAAAGGDQLGRTVVDRLVLDVAMAVAGVVAVVDPERVILDGSIGRALEPWLPTLREAVASQVFAAPEVVVSGLGGDATITGAVARALAMVSELDAPAHLSRLRKG
jgi:glucokinase